MRYPFGSGIADYVVRPADGLWGVAPNTILTFWDAATDGTAYTDLLDAVSTPVTSVTTDAYGALPTFYGPDNVTSMWADAGGTSRALIEAHGSSGDTVTTKSLVVTAPAGAVSYVVWRATRACTVTAVHGYRSGGTAATINALRAGADLAATDLSLSTADTWLSAPTLQNTAVAAGDSLAVAVRSVSGSPTAVTIQIELQG